jgi:hypothetical protein
MKIYVACGLTHVPRDIFIEYVQFLHSLAASLSAHEDRNEVKYALLHSDPQLANKPFEDRARLCYLWDRQMVEEAELVIAECSFPSIGLGIELQIAEAKDTPIALCYRDLARNKSTSVQYDNPDHTRHQLQIGEGFVSLMALGLPSVVRVIAYSTDEDGIRQIGASVAAIKKN